MGPGIRPREQPIVQRSVEAPREIVDPLLGRAVITAAPATFREIPDLIVVDDTL